MKSIKEIEAYRLREQERLDSDKVAFERNKLGQFATPPQLALEIVRYARKQWDGKPVKFLDPALGTGSFFSALLQTFNEEDVSQALGIELDEAFSTAASSLWTGKSLKVISGDFTKQSPPNEEEAFNLIISNPPYIRHHHLPLEDKERLRASLARTLGVSISGLSGLYCYFLLLSHAWLSRDGLAFWLIPSEFMDVNYGVVLKRYLTTAVTLLHIHRFCPSDLQFTDALVSSAVVAFRKGAPPMNHKVTMSFGGSILQPNASEEVAVSVLASSRKWTIYPILSQKTNAKKSGRILLKDLFHITCGIATSANKFFIVPYDDLEKLGVPSTFVRPILPSPRYIEKAVIDSNKEGFPIVEPRLSLIDCSLPEPEVREKFPSFWEYLQSGKDQKIHETYIASRRSPWYSQEKREVPPFLCTYMGRYSEHRHPFRFFWNKSQAIAHNVYLLLYPKGVLKDALESNPSLYSAVFEGLNHIEPGNLLTEGRVYGGGLYKMEPKELGFATAETVISAARLGQIQKQITLFE